MKKMTIAFLPLLLFSGIILQDENCRQMPHTTILDGPYILYRGEKMYVKYILDNHGTKVLKEDSMAISQRSDFSFDVLTDEPGKTFKVKLKGKLEEEASEYNDAKKQFIISDIEANFSAFRKLLQANKVIDADYKWTFGDGHLVLTGDFVDRGQQQTEVLWLIYSLEEQAKAAGGHVHYVLGNHEIMNMSGDLRYLHKKYIEHSALLKEGFTTLYGEHSEIGRWLRTKNIVEKVGDILFCHAGISQPVNRLDLSATKINKLVRPYYADSTYQYDKPETDTLYSDQGPFWYRGYYAGARATHQQVDSTLAAHKVKHVATGHTVIADTVSVLYNGKVFNTDVHHALGHIEALSYENGRFFRITSLGERLEINTR